MKNFFFRYRRYLPIVLILLIAAFLRLYRISDYMTFLGDEGRDALVWLRMIRDGKFTLLGPMTSIGNMYLGPLYYYLMLPFFLIFQNPVGPSVGVAIFSTLTVFLLWWMGKQWFNEKVGLIAASFYAISPVVVTLSRSSWNPNVMPFFALLTIWGIWQMWQKNRFIWLIGIGICLSFAIQSHYLGLLLIPTIMVFWLTKLLEVRKNNKVKNFLILSAMGLGSFILLTVVPLVWFDLRHGFINYKSFALFFTDRQTTVNFKIYKAIPNLWPLWETINIRLLAASDIFVGKIISVLIAGGIIFVLFKRFKTFFKDKPALILLGTWILVGLVGLGLYKQHIYDHYFGFIFPAVFMLLGFLIDQLFSFSKIGKVIGLFCLVFITILNLKQLPLKFPPLSQMKRVQEVDKKLVSVSGGKPYNFSLIAKRNYDAGYVFFLDYWGKKPVSIDPQKFEETITDQLFVVCEDLPCQPVNNPNVGIANFGWSKIERQWNFPWGVQLYKLVPNE